MSFEVGELRQNANLLSSGEVVCFDSNANALCFALRTQQVGLLTHGDGGVIRKTSVKERPVQVALPRQPESDDRLAAIAFKSGRLGVLDKSFASIVVFDALLGSCIDALQFDSVGQNLYVGNNVGQISVFRFGTSQDGKEGGVSRILELTHAVVQISVSEDILAVSTEAQSVVCHTRRKHFHEIGSRPRYGHFGATIQTNHADSDPIVWCARPGLRIWKADLEGNVLATLQLKNIVTHSRPGKNHSFSRIFCFGETSLVSYFKSFIYIIDTNDIEASEAIDMGAAIADLRVADRYKTVWVLFVDGRLKQFKIRERPLAEEDVSDSPGVSGRRSRSVETVRPTSEDPSLDRATSAPEMLELGFLDLASMHELASVTSNVRSRIARRTKDLIKKTNDKLKELPATDKVLRHLRASEEDQRDLDDVDVERRKLLQHELSSISEYILSFDLASPAAKAPVAEALQHLVAVYEELHSAGGRPLPDGDSVRVINEVLTACVGHDFVPSHSIADARNVRSKFFAHDEAETDSNLKAFLQTFQHDLVAHVILDALPDYAFNTWYFLLQLSDIATRGIFNGVQLANRDSHIRSVVDNAAGARNISRTEKRFLILSIGLVLIKSNLIVAKEMLGKYYQSIKLQDVLFLYIVMSETSSDLTVVADAEFSSDADRDVLFCQLIADKAIADESCKHWLMNKQAVVRLFRDVFIRLSGDAVSPKLTTIKWVILQALRHMTEKLKFCKDIGFWPGFFETLDSLPMSERWEHLPDVLKHGDGHTLAHLKFLDTKDSCSVVLSLLKQLQPTDVSRPCKVTSWNDIGRQIIRIHGARKCTMILLDNASRLPTACLPARFYRELIIGSLEEREEARFPLV